MKCNSVTILAIIFWTLFSCNEERKPINNSTDLRAQKIDSLLTYCHNNGMFNGAIAVVKNDTLIFKNSYGQLGKESNKAIDAETLFYIASVSKQFTAMGIMILQERGLLDYGDPIVNYLELESIDNKVTIQQLLNHTSGISDRKYYQLEKPNNQDVLEALKSSKLEDFGTPNNRFSYSNSGYVLLALIIEKVAKKPIDVFFQDEIFNKLGMTRTIISKEDLNSEANKVQPYSIIGKKADYESSVVGPGGIYSTINDLVKWNSALNQHRLISAKTLELAFSNGKLKEGEISFEMSNQTFGYGFGWTIPIGDSTQIVMHDGSTVGYRSLIRKDLSNNIDVILLTNHGGAFAMDEIVAGLDEIFEKLNYQAPKVPIPNMVVNELKSKDIENVINKLSIRIAKDGKLDERVLGRLGYTFLNEGMTEEAIGLFQFNLEMHPESTNALYVLGEAYISTEQYAAAKEIYNKFLKLKPKSEHATKRLEFIENQLNNSL